MSGQMCHHAGCPNVGVFDDVETDDAGIERAVKWCFVHSSGDIVVAPEPAGEVFHTDVVAGLAAMVLEHTAMTTLDATDATGDAMRSLGANTGWTDDVAAGVLLATTYIMAAGQVDAEQLLHGAELFERQAEGDDQDDDVPEVVPEVETVETRALDAMLDAEPAEVVPCVVHGLDFAAGIDDQCVYCSTWGEVEDVPEVEDAPEVEDVPEVEAPRLVSYSMVGPVHVTYPADDDLSGRFFAHCEVDDYEDTFDSEAEARSWAAIHNLKWHPDVPSGDVPEVHATHTEATEDE